MAVAKNRVLFESLCYLSVDIVRHVAIYMHKRLTSSNDRFYSIRKY
jgi:hypothetical protein